MKFATWNVNSLNVRLDHVLQWLASNPVDILCLQELKQTEEKYPFSELQQAGYVSVWAGQPTYNGVAILSRTELIDMQRNLPNFEDPQQRLIAATINSYNGSQIRVVNAYCPNGQSVDSDKYEYKLAWYQALSQWLASEIKQYPNLLLLGDYNIAPADADVHDPDKWIGSILVSEPERKAFESLIALGLVDTFRLFEQEPNTFSWWDYRRGSFRRNAGMRIDHILASEPMAKLCNSCLVDIEPRTWQKPSDHAPVIASFDI